MLELKNYKIKLLYDLQVDKKHAIKLEKIKRGEKISIMSDTMLKAMFQNNNRLKYSVKFLSYFLEISYEDLLNNIYLTKNELDKEKEKSKGERCDYVANIKDTSLNIEVNNNSNVDIMDRNIEYAYRLFSKKIKRGEKIYKYTQVIQFNLNNFCFKENDKIIDIYTLRNDEGLALNNKLTFVQIYIPNLRKKWYNCGTRSLTEKEKYILSLVETNIRELESLGDDPIMNEYIKEAEVVSFDDETLESYDKEWALKDEYMRDGKKEGIKEGIEQEKLHIAKNMLENNVKIEDISKYTELSIEEIESLK